MDWNRVKRDWQQIKRPAKEKWGKLTDDGLNIINGGRGQLEGTIQQWSGFEKDQIHKNILQTGTISEVELTS
jgi:uncharacterized protein YjbJ (UPF0337 family)